MMVSALPTISLDGQTSMQVDSRVSSHLSGTHVTVKKPVSNGFVLTPSNFNEVVKNSGKVVFVKELICSGVVTASISLPPTASSLTCSPRSLLW